MTLTNHNPDQRGETGPRFKKAGETVVFSVALGLTVPSLLLLWRSGFLYEQLSDWRTPVMYLELILAAVLLILADRCISGRRARAVTEALIVCGFLWAHRIFLPLFVTGMYFAGLAVIGETVLLPLRKREGISLPGDVQRASHDFLTGCAVMMVFLCFLSGIHVGGIGTARKAAAFLILLAFLVLQLFRVSGLLPLPYTAEGPDREPAAAADRIFAAGTGGWEKERRFLLFGILLILMLHAGRMNITLDYDSVHYGLRSGYILDNGMGIFENLGSVNAVYFYPKGLEILALPLSGTPTYAFVLSFSFWCAVFFLVLTGDLTARCFGSRAGLRAAFLCACIPGIMNLSTSAKTDMVTLLFQMMFLAEMPALLGGNAGGEPGIRSLFWGLAALAMTLALKPTAIAFSGLLFLSTAAFLLLHRKEITFGFLPKPWAAGLILFFPCIALLGVTLRTVHLTGYPLVTVFTGIWEKIGFHGHYPLAVQEVPDSSAGYSAAELAGFLLQRIGAVFVAPSEDKDLHILIAWGTTLFPALLLAAAIRAGQEVRGRAGQEALRKDAGPGRLPLRYLLFTLAVFLCFDLVTLKLLYQVDGNYYDLSYALAAVTAAALWEGGLLRALTPAIVMALFMTSITNWAGARGFTELKLDHYGFYDHESDVMNYMILNAKEPIYRYLKNAPRIHLLTMSDEPECYLYPCRAESYTDLEGSGGNVRLVKTL
ncbi:MAG: hypothetical protein IJT43_03100, partial [Stomatobaculum sp.]|nr:hypothetical protein [Stomatobaculum sp.]